MERHVLSPLFSPEAILVFTENATASSPPSASAGSILLQALQAAPFPGTITAMSTQTTGTLADLAQSRADLALIAVPDAEVASALEIAGRIRCRTAVVISSDRPAAECQALQGIAAQYGMSLLGPNSLGFQRPHLKLNASTAGDLAQAGPLALVAQSGAMTVSILDWAHRNGVGFSSVISLSANSPVDLPQVLDFLATDATTQGILVYMESIRDARRFMSALRAAAHTKPIVVMKAGHQPHSRRMAQTHIASLVGADEVFEAALRRAGVVRVRSVTQLLSVAKCLASRYRPVGRRLAVITNGGGPGVVAADWASALGLDITSLSELAHQKLLPKLAPVASMAPVLNLGEDATAAHYTAAVEACMADPQVNGTLVLYAPKPGTDSQAIAEAIATIHRRGGKPLLACWMGDEHVSSARHLLNQASVPNFRTPEAGVDAFHDIASFYAHQQLLQQTPPPLTDLVDPDTEGARLLIEGVLTERRKVLTEMESKALLAAYHIPVTRTLLARSATEAMLIAAQLGYPVALKIDSPDIPHKSDVHGVALDLMTAAQVRETYHAMMALVQRAMPQAQINGVTVQPMSGKKRGREIYIGLTTDEAFGPVITFGAGGRMIELINDRAMELPPLNQFLARRLIERSRAMEILENWHNSPTADIQALEQILLRVSEMVCELPHLREMDINPIIVNEDGAVAVDARIVVDHAPPSDADYSHLAILPYPVSYEREWPMKGGDLYTIRPIRPDDALMLQDFTRHMSPESRYFRFVSAMAELPPKMLARYTLIDYDREMALVAVHRKRTPKDHRDDFDETEQIIGVSRYITLPEPGVCEFSLAVSDSYTGQGLGSRLMLSIMEFARSKGLTEIQGLVLSHNDGMLRLMRSLDFTMAPFPEDPDFRLCTKSL